MKLWLNVEQIDNVHVHILHSSPESRDVEDRDYDSQGRIDVDLFKRLLPFDDYELYLCGRLRHVACN